MQKVTIHGREYDDISMLSPQTMTLIRRALFQSGEADTTLQQAFLRDDVMYAVDVEELGEIVAANFHLRSLIRKFLARRAQIGYASEEE